MIKKVIIGCFFLGALQLHGTTIDSLKQQLEFALSDSVRIEISIALSSELSDKGEYAAAKKYANNSIRLSQSINSIAQIGNSHYTLGYAYDLEGTLDSAIYHYELSRQKYQAIDNKTEVANAMNAKGIAAYFQGEFDVSLMHNLEALKYVETHQLDDVMSRILNNLGVIYRTTNKHDEAIEIYKKNLKLSQRLGNEEMQGTTHHNLGVAYGFKKEADQALKYLDSAISNYELLKLKDSEAKAWIAKAEVYYEANKDFRNTEKHILQGLKLMNFQESDQEFISKTYLLLAKSYRDSEQPAKAIQYFQKGLNLIEKTERYDLISEFYQDLEILYNAQGNKVKAHEYLTKYITLFKKVQSSESLKAIEELQTKYQTEQKEQEIALLNIEKKVSASKIRNSKIITGLLIGGLSILSFLLFNIFKLYKRVKKSDSEKETLLKEIHHRVKNNLQVISALLTLQAKHIKNDEAIDALQKGQDRVQSMALIHQDLYQHDDLKGVNTKDYFEKLATNLVDSYQVEGNQIDVKIEVASINLDVDTMIPLGLVVNELISNALKYAFTGKEKGEIALSLNENEEGLLLVVKDDGKGITDDQFQNSSFGYSLIKSFARRLEGELEIANDNGLKVSLKMRQYKKM